MGFKTGDFPPVDPDTFFEKPFFERIPILSRHWVEYGCGTPKMVHAIYIVKLLAFYIFGGVLVATLTSGIHPFWDIASWCRSPSCTRSSSSGRCCSRRSAWPGRGGRWPGTSSP